jgi:hypothetical protein
VKVAIVIACAATMLLISGCTSTNNAPSAGASARSSVEASPSATPTPTPTASQYISDPASSHTVASDDGTEVSWYSPSKNIECAIVLTGSFASLWGCTVHDHTWQAPSANAGDICYNAGEDCGSGLEAMGTGKLKGRSEFVFESQRAIDGGIPPAGPISALAYGHSVTADGVTCVSLETGMTCSNAISGHRFTLSKSTYSMN